MQCNAMLFERRKLWENYAFALANALIQKCCWRLYHLSRLGLLVKEVTTELQYMPQTGFSSLKSKSSFTVFFLYHLYNLLDATFPGQASLMLLCCVSLYVCVRVCVCVCVYVYVYVYV
eukprot:c21715_g1_i1 orf=1-351(-)